MIRSDSGIEGSVNTRGVDDGGVVGEMVGSREIGVVRNDTVGRGSKLGVSVGIAIGISAKAVLTVDMAVDIMSVALVVGVEMKLLQAASIPAAKTKGINALSKMFTFHKTSCFDSYPSKSCVICLMVIVSGWVGYSLAKIPLPASISISSV